MIGKTLWPAALALALLLLGGAATAAPTPFHVNASESRVLSQAGQIERILLANPEVAAVKALNSRELLITGKRAGRTELVVWINDGSEVHYDLEVGLEAGRRAQIRDEVAALVRQLDADGKVTVALQNDHIVLGGSVPNGARSAGIAKAVESLGYSVVNLITVEGSQQVKLEVRVAEVIKGNPMRSGVSFMDKRDRFGLLAPGTAASTNFLLDLNQSMSEATLNAPYVDAFQIAVNPAHAALFGLLNLMEGHNLARVLAQPTLVVESGKTAKFLAGGEVPIPVAQQNNTISVEYKKFGVLVEFTPTILDHGEIVLAVQPEVSNIDPNAGISVGGLTIPGFRTRRTETTVRVMDGESFVVGGLQQEEIRNAVNQVPLLGDIPVLGALFRSSSYENDRSELAIVVTPHIVKPLAAGSRIPLPGDGLKAPTAAEAFLLGRVAGGSERLADNGGLEMPQ